MRYQTKISDEEIKAAINSYSSDAVKVISDPAETEKLISKFRKWLRKGKDYPVIGKSADDLAYMTELLEDYRNKIYTDISISDLVVLVAILIYVLSPIDIIPDVVPGIGFLDDTVVIIFALKTCLNKELEKYKIFRKYEKKEKNKELSLKLANLYGQLLQGKVINAIILTEEKKLKFLYTMQETDQYPIECKVLIYDIPIETLSEYYITENEEIIGIYRDAFENTSDLTNKIDIAFEADSEEFAEKYIILGN